MAALPNLEGDATSRWLVGWPIPGFVSGPATYSSDKSRGAGERFVPSDITQHMQFQAQLIFVGLDVVACPGWATFQNIVLRGQKLWVFSEQ